MEALKQRIQAEGENLGEGILRVNTFVNHQIDPALMAACACEFTQAFRGHKVTKILTAEISGIGPAVLTALFLGVPVVYARKQKPITMSDEVFATSVQSHTKGTVGQLVASPEVLGPRDRVLIIDDFLATGKTIAALVELVKQAGATLVGIGTLIEKSFEGGREALSNLDVPIVSLVDIVDMSDGKIVFV